MVLGVQKLIRSRLMLQVQFGDNPFLVFSGFSIYSPYCLMIPGHLLSFCCV